MTQINSSLKSAGYDNPAYVARQGIFLVRAAGATGQSAKYAAHAALVVYGMSYNVTAAGTSTYTVTGVNGSATVGINADTLALLVVQNTNTVGTGSVALATTTYGPYGVFGQFVGGGTYTNQVGQSGQLQINTNSGTAGLGGIVIPAGALFWVQGGTDATSALAVTVDYNIQPLAAVPA